jgi:cholesterol transport system auxiliary component
MPIKRLSGPAAAAALVLLVGACSLPTRPGGETVATYLLEWSPEGGERGGSPVCPTLLVATPRAAPGFATARMVYREGGYQVQYFARHQWADSPAQMMHPLMVRALEHEGRFRAVVGPDAGGRAGLLLDAEGLRLEQIFEADRSRVDLAARVSLVDLARQQVLGAREIRVEAPAAAADPRAGVQAANRAVGEFLERLGGFVARTLAAQPSVCGPGPRDAP